MLGLLPWQFGALTPGEFGELLEHAEHAEDRAWERTATLVAHVRNSITGEAVRVADFMPERETTPRPARDGRAELSALRQQFLDPHVVPALR